MLSWRKIRSRYCKTVVTLTSAGLLLLFMVVALRGWNITIPFVLGAGFLFGWAHGHDHSDERFGNAAKMASQLLAARGGIVPKDKFAKLQGACDDANAIITRLKAPGPVNADTVEDAQVWVAHYEQMRRENT